MGRINWGRVIGGGLLAGLVINLFEIGFGIVMEKYWEAATGHEIVMVDVRKSTAMVAHLGWAFVMGIVLVWLYAAIRPRFGPGAKTAAIAGVVVWLLAHVTVALAFGTLDFVSDELMTYGALWALPETIVAALVGAWIYRESA